MTVKEYLGQGYRLEQRIHLSQLELEQLRDLAKTVSAVGFEEHFNATRNTSAPFENTLMKIMEMEEQERMMIEELLQFKKELKTIIGGIENKDERLVMYYRYCSNMRWTDIADRLGWDARTIKRWHNKAIAKIIIPDNPTIIDENLKNN